ncbi:pyridoxal phosphate-dependent decarboxylase family protein [Maribacter hydrothermalis]|uniref:Pyridoxal-dependent decarboxylase n=1 Tax=Maribacter hydrothermalis TaxID=1836467 RepID=A0A1B7Z7Q0_9FLAO|nr:aminotransferase class V-fold PLP-dependent enzyme [Maribacter hydrothermalis]APQ15915.1 pyridoxal-dependent decarboxylase [Maribacter hydrothermalis]OBR38706.1 pyridoxal-dependent decarboxylase [Maribacter hydrothermalis]
MNKKLLLKVYNVEEFNSNGHLLIDQLTSHLEDKLNAYSKNAINWNEPEHELKFWKDFLKNGSKKDLFKEITKHTTYTHHPHYLGHQVSPPAPITALTGLISSLLNNGTAVYEMGMASNAIERIIIELVCNKIGFKESSSGFLTSGGTLANLTALLSARKAITKKDIWNEGNQNQLGIMVSEEAHYCVDRAARIMGLGNQGIIKVPVTREFQMDTSLLESKFEEAKAKGIEVFAIIGSAPSTATGIFDDLETIGGFAEKQKIWFHVDGAHGGAGIFSKKYRHTLNGIDKADSVVIDGHKMMMMPALTTALLFKNEINSKATFSQKADYLLSDSEHEDWYNSGKRTFECTKNMMSIHWFTLLKLYGEEVFDANVTQLYDMGAIFANLIAEEPNFEVALQPMSNIVCFRFIEPGMSTEYLNELNIKIRQALLEDGEFYIVQTKLKGVHYMRITVMNPFTTLQHFKALIEKIKLIKTSI